MAFFSPNKLYEDVTGKFFIYHFQLPSNLYAETGRIECSESILFQQQKITSENLMTLQIAQEAIYRDRLMGFSSTCFRNRFDGSILIKQHKSSIKVVAAVLFKWCVAVISLLC